MISGASWFLKFSIKFVWVDFVTHVCGQGRETIPDENFVIVYRLGKNGELTFPDHNNDIMPPHSPVCLEHLRRVPDAEYVDRPGLIDETVYGVSRKYGVDVIGDSPILSKMIGFPVAIANFGEEQIRRYLPHQAMKRHLPRALEIIAVQVLDQLE